VGALKEEHLGLEKSTAVEPGGRVITHENAAAVAVVMDPDGIERKLLSGESKVAMNFQQRVG
jgi:hypothetical protein